MNVGMYVYTIVLVMKRPNDVKRKLVNENWLVSRGRYQVTGESAARSFSDKTFKERMQ